MRYCTAESRLNKKQRLNKLLFSKIYSDLEPWQKKKITLQQVERTYCTAYSGGYVDGGFRLQVFVPPSRLLHTHSDVA